MSETLNDNNDGPRGKKFHDDILQKYGYIILPK